MLHLTVIFHNQFYTCDANGFAQQHPGSATSVHHVFRTTKDRELCRAACIEQGNRAGFMVDFVEWQDGAR